MNCNKTGIHGYKFTIELLFKLCSNAHRLYQCHYNATEPEPLCDDQVVSGRVAALSDDPHSPPSSARPALPPPQKST